MPGLPPFHLALPVDDLAAARAFYGGVLRCPEGRSAARWVDFDFFGHQFVVHLRDDGRAPTEIRNPVDGHEVPAPHFGVVLTMPDWEALVERLRSADVAFVIEPHLRFAGRAGEQATCFVRDPAGHALEFKAFRDMDRLFARDVDTPSGGTP